MLLEVLFLTGLMLVLGLSVWWSWSQRQQAIRQAKINAEMAELGRGLRAVAHDISNQFEVIIKELDRVREDQRGEVGERLDDVAVAARGAARIFQELRSKRALPAGGPPRRRRSKVCCA